MRRPIFLMAAIVFLVVGFALAHYPTKVQVDVAAKKQPAVTFDHAKHGDTLVKTCDTCHHNHKGLGKAQADTVDVKKCSECHLDPQGKVPSMREASPTKNPLHIGCIDCHKEQKKGPTVCKGCHVKK